MVITADTHEKHMPQKLSGNILQPFISDARVGAGLNLIE